MSSSIDIYIKIVDIFYNKQANKQINKSYLDFNISRFVIKLNSFGHKGGEILLSVQFWPAVILSQ